MLCCGLWDVLRCGLWGVLHAQACCGMCCGLCQGCAALSAVLQAVLWGEAVCCPVWPPTQSAAPSLPAPALSSFGFQYLSQQYLPLKLQEGDWI